LDFVDAIRDHEGRSRRVLRKEVPERTIEAPCQADAIGILGDEGVGARDREYPARIVREQSAPRLDDIEVPELLARRVHEIDDPRDWSFHLRRFLRFEF
jgi:hypothetical protein